MDIPSVLSIVLLAFTYVKGQTELCHEGLVSKLPDDHLTASSVRSENGVVSTPVQGRLNSTERTLNNGTTLMGAWAPAGEGGYIQANFDELTMITELQTQGRNQGNDRVTIYTVEYTQDGNTWQTLNDDIGVEQLFQGNSDGDTVQTNELLCPIFAKGIRIVPREWNPRTALRFEVNGCYIDNTVAAVVTTLASTPSILTTQTAAGLGSSVPAFLPGIPTPFGTQNTQSSVNLLTLVSVTTPSTALTTPTTLRTTPTTTPDMFLPGIQNPFGTTRVFNPGSGLIG